MGNATPTRPVVIRAHESSPQLCYLDIAPDLNPVMGRFPPARLVGRPGRAYLLAEIHLAPFLTFARRQRWVVIDERHSGEDPTATSRDRPLPECFHCGQPASRRRPPLMCPNCGRRWRPIEVRVATRGEALVEPCPGCGTSQPAGFPYCGRCGIRLPSREQRAAPRWVATQDPLPIGAAIAELAGSGGPLDVGRADAAHADQGAPS